MVKVAASLDSKHLRVELRCNIALEMDTDTEKVVTCYA